MTATYVDIAIRRSSFVSRDSFVSWETIVRTSATSPPASEDFTMIDTTRWTIGVFTRSEKRRRASVAGTPQLIWAAIFLISGVSLPYRPLEETTMASARVMPNRPASATSRRKSGSRRSICLISRGFLARENPYGPMNARLAIASHIRNRSMLRWPSRKPRFTEPMRLRKAMNPKRARRVTLVARRRFFRSAFEDRRTRAFSRSSRTMSGLLFHVPDDEDEPELAHRDHEADNDVQQHHDEARAGLADEGHDCHDDDQEQGEGHDDGDEGLGQHPEGLHLLPHLEAVFLLELFRLEEEVRLELSPARGRRDDALQEVL